MSLQKSPTESVDPALQTELSTLYSNLLLQDAKPQRVSLDKSLLETVKLLPSELSEPLLSVLNKKKDKKPPVYYTATSLGVQPSNDYKPNPKIQNVVADPVPKVSRMQPILETQQVRNKVTHRNKISDEVVYTTVPKKKTEGSILDRFRNKPKVVRFETPVQQSSVTNPATITSNARKQKESTTSSSTSTDTFTVVTDSRNLSAASSNITCVSTLSDTAINKNSCSFNLMNNCNGDSYAAAMHAKTVSFSRTQIQEQYHVKGRSTETHLREYDTSYVNTIHDECQNSINDLMKQKLTIQSEVCTGTAGRGLDTYDFNLTTYADAMTTCVSNKLASAVISTQEGVADDGNPNNITQENIMKITEILWLPLSFGLFLIMLCFFVLIAWWGLRPIHIKSSLLEREAKRLKLREDASQWKNIKIETQEDVPLSALNATFTPRDIREALDRDNQLKLKHVTSTKDGRPVPKPIVRVSEETAEEEEQDAEIVDEIISDATIRQLKPAQEKDKETTQATDEETKGIQRGEQSAASEQSNRRSEQVETKAVTPQVTTEETPEEIEPESNKEEDWGSIHL